MFKKVLVCMLALTFVFAATGCKEEEIQYVDFPVSQGAQNSTVTYNGMVLDATVVDFAKAETPEKVYSIFGNTSAGKTDVSFLGRVQIIDGNVVVGLSVGDEPRMAGVYVKGFGYYFINSANLTAGKYAVCLTGVPVGTFQMSTFSIIEDDFAVDKQVASFTKDQALLLAGENEGGFTLETGKLLLKGQGYQALEDNSFVVAKNDILNVGEMKAMIKGDAGLTLGVQGSTTEDVSKASYIYAGIKDGNATIISSSMGEEKELGKTAIEGYEADSQYELSVRLELVSAEPRKTKIVLSLNGTELVIVEELVEANKNVGFIFLKKSAEVESVNIPPCSLDEYKAYAKEQFDNLVQVEFYEEHITGLTTSYIDKVTKNYNDETKYMFVAREYSKAVKAIDNATDIENATTVYNKHYEALKAEVLDTYKDDIESSLKSVAENWYSIMFLDEEVKNFPEQDKNGDNIPDVTVRYAGGGEEYFNRGLDGIDGETFDYRWWIPKPLRTPNILTSAHKEIAKCNSKDVLKIMYEEYYDAVFRSVCQKVIEEYHAIKHEEKDGFLWEVCWNYCGDTVGGLSTFVYDGPVTEYKGVEYGVSNETQFRLSPVVYKPGECGGPLQSGECYTHAEDIEAGCKCMVSLFNYAMNLLK